MRVGNLHKKIVDSLIGSSCTRVEVVASKVLNAGLGVFTKQRILKDSLVTFYPGIYFPPPPLWVVASPDGEPALNLNSHMKNNYIIHCNSCGGFIDGFDEGRLGTNWRDSRAMGHLINHPPKGSLPSVFCLDFQWDHIISLVKQRIARSQNCEIKDFAAQLAERVGLINSLPKCGPWYYDPAKGVVDFTKNCNSVVGIAFFSLVDISIGDEIYFDYKFESGDRNIPDWYHPVACNRTVNNNQLVGA